MKSTILNKIKENYKKENVITFKIDGELNEDLNQFCKENFINKSSFIREAIKFQISA